MVDVSNKEILSESKMNDRWYPASLTKLMTAYVTFRSIQNGELEEGSPVTISLESTRQPPSKMGYKIGVQLRVDTALKIIIIKSANDVSHALAEAVSGSLDAFVEEMNSEARRLGMTNTNFVNSNGLHNPRQYTSARDMAALSAQILQEFPEYAYMFETAAIKTSSKTHYSYNLLLERFPGTTGMKTGFVCASGYNMVASAKRKGRSLIAVVLGRSSQKDRAVSAAKLLETGFKGSGNQVQPLNIQAPSGANPVNMRPALCTEQARRNRYDPAAGQAKLDSPHLKPRIISSKILTISTGGIDAPPSNAYLSKKYAFAGKPPVPSRRPQYDPASGKITLLPLGIASSGAVPLPTPRPQ